MDYTTAELVKWLGEEKRLLGWDMIFFIDGEKINAVLKQEAIRRLNTADNMPPISGYIPNGAGYRFALSRCSLQLPRLMFDPVLAGNKAHLQMAIAEANVYALKDMGSQWQVRQLDVMSPLQAADLNLDIDLEQSGGAVEQGGTIKLDLSNTENFSMPGYVGDSRLLAEFFRQQFAAMTDEQRQYPIGKLENIPFPLYQPASFALRTQARGRSKEDAEGAVLLLVSMEGETEGSYPGADYKYLIPNDGDYSATALFNTNRLITAQLEDAIRSVIDELKFRFRLENDIPHYINEAGVIKMPGQAVEKKISVLVPGGVWEVNVDAQILEANLDVSHNIVVINDNGLARIIISLRQKIQAQILDFDDGSGMLKNQLQQAGCDLGAFMAPTEGALSFDFYFTYSVKSGMGANLVLGSATYIPLGKFDPQFASLMPSPPLGPFHPVYRLVIGMWMLNPMLADWLEELVSGSGTEGFTSIRKTLATKLATNLKLMPGIQAITSDILKLGFGNVIQGTNLQIPLETVCFGQVNAATTTFTLTPMEKIMLAGSWQQFITQPVSDPVVWSAQAVSGIAEGVSLSIEDGDFTAPTAREMTRSTARVKVTATNKTNSVIHSSALVTVLSESLHATPSIVVAQAGSKVDFNAWAVGDPLKLEWKYQDNSLGTGQSATVTCPADTNTVAFMVEEVLVTDPDSKQTCACVLVTEMSKKQPMLLIADVDLAGTKAVLEARINGNLIDPKNITWDVLYGPGHAPAGVYTPGGNTAARFALISATYDTDSFGVFEGYIVLALPLAEHKSITAVQAE